MPGLAKSRIRKRRKIEREREREKEKERKGGSLVCYHSLVKDSTKIKPN